MISLIVRAKDGGVKTNNGEIREEAERTGETLKKRGVGGEMVLRIKELQDGRELLEENQEVGEDRVEGENSGGRESLPLVVVGEMEEIESGATLMRDPPGEIWMKGDPSEEDGKEVMWVEASPTRTGGVPNPTQQQQQHRYQTAKWHQ